MLRSTLNEYAGLYFIAIGFGAIGSGWANGGKWLFGALGQFLATRLARFLPFLIGSFFCAFAVMSSWRTPLGLIFFYLSTFSYGIIQNETQAMAQKHLDSGLRATALSLINFGTSTLMIPLGLAFGWLAQHRSVFAAYQLFAIIGLFYFVIWFFWRRTVSIRPVTPGCDGRNTVYLAASYSRCQSLRESAWARWPASMSAVSSMVLASSLDMARPPLREFTSVLRFWLKPALITYIIFERLSCTTIPIMTTF
ncbi:MAG: hypothetical protein WDN27_05410 [Candidatus Saccharibacteria bacterium]